VIKEIRKLLEKSAKAHRLYEQKILEGVYDKRWSDWYSKYLLKEGLRKYLPNVSFKILTNFLKKSNEEMLKLNKNLNWTKYTSEKIYEKFLN